MNEEEYLKIQKGLTNLFLILGILIMLIALILKTYIGTIIGGLITIVFYIYLRISDKKEESRLSDNTNFKTASPKLKHS